MEDKHKKRTNYFTHFLASLFLTAFLFRPDILISYTSSEASIIVSEIMYDPEGADSNYSDWIEIYNPVEETITIKKENFGLIDEEKLELGKDGEHYLNCHSIKEDFEIKPGDFMILADNKDKFISAYPLADPAKIIDTTFSLSSEGDHLKISNDKCETFFIDFPYSDSWGANDNGSTLEKIKLNDDYAKDNWQESYQENGTPLATRSIKPTPKEYSTKIRLNEILPAPTKKDDEYIELYNSTEKDIDLSDWILKDSSKTGKYIFPKDAVIEAEDYLIIYKKDFKFSLNNTGNETVYLYDPAEKEVSSVSYKSAKENISYNFINNSWRWSATLTPGKENVIDVLPSIEIKKDRNIYKNIYAAFEAKFENSKNYKFTWDFGDGHKSYLQKTRHKYENKGTYQGSLKVRTTVEDIIQEFSVKVKDYPKPKIKIVGLIPNPEGKDTKKNEWIEIKNNTKKKINLKDWSIATGWDKMVSHPIREKFEIKPGQTKKLKRDICAFTLNNTKTKIELRYPDGKVADKIKYDRKKDKIEEDETYEKINDEWQWIEPEENSKEKQNNIKTMKETNPPIGLASEDSNNSTKTSAEMPPQIQGASEENIINYTPNPQIISKKQIALKILALSPRIKMPETLLNTNGKVSEASRGIKYYSQQKHWSIEIADNFLTKINYWVNRVINW